MPADARKLARLHRVRTLQLGLARADEAAARDRFDGEATLARRIGQLTAAVEQRHGSAAGVSLAAGAHYRQRLHESADAAAARVRAAEAVAARAAEATRSARRDQSAIEKLIARADIEAALKALRSLEEAPASANGTKLAEGRP